MGIHGLGFLCKSWEDEEENTEETFGKVSVRCLLTFEWSRSTVRSALDRLSIWGWAVMAGWHGKWLGP